MIRVCRSSPHTGTVVQPETSPGRLLLRHLQAFLPPDSFHPLVIDSPAVIAEQACDLAIPLPAILTRQVDDGLCQGGLVIRQVSLIPLRGAGLPQHSTDPTFRRPSVAQQ